MTLLVLAIVFAAGWHVRGRIAARRIDTALTCARLLAQVDQARRDEDVATIISGLEDELRTARHAFIVERTLAAKMQQERDQAIEMLVGEIT
jgi:hypothetical protein